MTLALTFHSGCSFLFVGGPPANHAQMATFECTDSNAWPVVDTIWALLNGIGAVSAATSDQSAQNTQSAQGVSQDQIVAVGVGWLVISGISAISGYSKSATAGMPSGSAMSGTLERVSLPHRRCGIPTQTRHQLLPVRGVPQLHLRLLRHL
jgi:hypothetical protein